MNAPEPESASLLRGIPLEGVNPSAERRRITTEIELAMLVGLTVLVYLLANRFRWFESINRWILSWPSAKQLDGLVLAARFFAVGALVFAFRRWRDSRREVAAYRRAQDELRLLHGELEFRVQQRTADLRQSNQALRLQSAALTAAANAIVITDRAGTLVWVNPAFATLTGYTFEEAVGKNPRELVKSGQQDREIYQNLWDTVLSGRVWKGELINRRKDSSLYLEEQTITPVGDETGEITHFIAIKQDLTGRRRAEESLRESEERHRLLFEHNPLPMWLYDPKSLRFLAVNSAAVQNYGYTRDEFLSMTIKDIRPEEDVPGMQESLEHAPSEIRYTSEWRHRRKDGTIIRVEINSRPLLFADQETRLVLASDVTEKKLLEERFLHAQRLESVGMLAAGIAHDLNNVLAPVIIATPMLRESLSKPRDLKILDALEQSAARGAGLVKQILGFVHSTAGEFRPTQVKHLARDIVTIVEETFPKYIQCEHCIPADLWPVLGDATQIHQVLLNLCVNARDAMPEGGILSFAVSNRRLDGEQARALPGARPGAWLVMEVADTGSGIAPDVLAHIWEPFFTTKGPDKGTGLGLSTVRGIVANHHGFMTLDTAVGQGTTFRVFLPATEEKPTTSENEPTAIPAGNGECILVVDDDQAVRESIVAVLEKNNYRVVSANDGIEALSQFATQFTEIALVVTDLDMPNLGGTLLARIITQLYPGLRVLVISGLAQSEGGSLCIEEARKLAHAFLQKPFTSDLLRNTVHRVLYPSE